MEGGGALVEEAELLHRTRRGRLASGRSLGVRDERREARTELAPLCLWREFGRVRSCWSVRFEAGIGVAEEACERAHCSAFERRSRVALEALDEQLHELLAAHSAREHQLTARVDAGHEEF